MKYYASLVAFFMIVALPLAKSQDSLVSQPQYIKVYAQNNLLEMLSHIPVGQESLYGFNNREEFYKAQANEALKFVIYDDSLRQNTLSWRLPISVDGEYRALLTIEEHKGVLRLADFGAAVLAKDIQEHRSANVDCIGILRAYHFGGDFLIVLKQGQELYLPLTSACRSIASKRLKRKPYYDIKELNKMLAL